MKNLKQRRNLTAIERERLIQLDDVKSSDIQLLGHILIKYLQFNSDNDLNSKGEFWQNYDDIRNNMMSKTNDKAIREQLKRLVEGDYITYCYKGIEGDDKYRKAIHLSITDKTIDLIMGDDHELNSKDKYSILQEVRYKNKEKKVFTPEVFKTKTKMKKASPIIKPVVKPTEKHAEQTVEDNTTKPIEEPTKEIKPLKTSPNHFDDNRAKAKAIINNKNNPKIKDYLDKLKLTNYDIHFLLSNDYIDGSNRELDKRKNILNLIANNLIEA